MKKALALLLTLCVLIMCCACGNSDNSANDGQQKKDETPADQGNTDPAGDNTDPADDNTDEQEQKNGTVEVIGEADESYIISDDDTWSNKSTDQEVLFGTVPSTLNTPWDKVTLSHPASNTEAQAAAMRNSVVNSGNSNYTVTGTTYYISPSGNDLNDGKSPATAIRSTTRISSLRLQKGDALLFERGGVWHLTKAIKCNAGVTYGAYGTGEKPALFGSPANYADPKYWKASNLKNVWKLSISDTSIGLVVFDHGEIVGVKTDSGLLALAKNGDFYFNRAKSLLYLYYDGGNPGKAFKDIEVCLNKAAFDVNRVEDVTIDNFKIKYFGRLGIDLAAADNSVVKNCEVGFIGGANQNSTTRLGNAIQMWQGCVGHVVENCWVYQIYDTGITFQGDSISPTTRAKQGTHEEEYRDITYRNNLVEYCALSFELWHGNHNSDNGKSWSYSDAVFNNVHVENNLSRLAGYGWSSGEGQRPDPHGEHLVMYAHAYPYASEVYIENNIFDICDTWICRWDFSLEYSEDTNDATRKKINGVAVPIDNAHKNGIWTIRNNTYYHAANRTNGIIWYGGQKTGSGQSTLESVLSKFDSSPAKVVWVN